MAANADDVRRAAMAELARRELQRRERERGHLEASRSNAGFGRQLGLTARAALQGASDLAYMPFDALVGAYNTGVSKLWPEGYDVTINGEKQHRSGLLPTASEGRDAGLTALGLPEPETGMERVANMAVRGATGAGGIAKTAAQFSGPVASTLASRPLLQTVSGATGGAAAGTAREHGAGPIEQVAAGLLGGAGPALVAGGPRMVGGSSSTAHAGANASARVAGGNAGTETAITGGAQVSGRGGGHNFGTVGDDVSAGLNRAQQRAASRGQELGFRMTPGQATGSRALQQLEAKLESQPMTSGPFNAIKSQNQTVLNRAAADSIGIRSDVLDETALGTALEQMETVFRSAADDVPRSIDPQGFIRWIGQLQDDTRGLVSGVASHPLIEDITKFAQQGGATGHQLQSLTSKLGKAAYKQMTTPSGDRDLGIALYRAKDYVDDLLMQGMEAERLAAFQTARGQYRNLMLLTSRVGIINPSNGNVSGVALANALQTKDRRGYLFGGNHTPLYDAARFAQGFKPIVGDSGTATRSPLPSPTDFVLSLPFNIATRAYASSPSVRLAVGAQSAAQALRNPVRIPQMGELPAAGVVGGLTPSLNDPRQRRRWLNDILMAGPGDIDDE